MVKKHLKSVATPKTWPINRKKNKWVTRPRPGAHKLENSMALCTVLTQLIKCAKTNAEVKKLLLKKEILVDGSKMKDPRQPVGFMDVVDIPEIKEAYRIIFNNKGKLDVKSIEKKESDIKLCKITNKTCMAKGKIQLNLSDGRNITVDKDNYKVGDVIVLKFPKQEIKESLKLDKNAIAFLTGGKHMGEHGTIDEIKGENIIFKSNKGETYETLKKYAFVVGKDKPAISLPEFKD